MTELLEIAIAKVKSLPENEQDTIAAMILEELEDENKLKDNRQSKNLAESIQKRFAQLGGVDNLPAVSRDSMREPPQFN
jgi:hypothetical protein